MIFPQTIIRHELTVCDRFHPNASSLDYGERENTMNILYVVNADMEKPSFGNEQRTRLIYDALCKLGDVHILDVRTQGEFWRGRKFLRLAPQKGLKRLANAIWHRLVVRPCKKCIMPFYPFPLRWSIKDYFPGVRFDVVVVTAIEYIGVMALWNVAPRLYADIDDLPMQVFETLHAPTLGRIRRIFSRYTNELFSRLVEKKISGCWVANAEQVAMVRTRGKTILLQNIPFGVNGVQEHSLVKNSDDATVNDKYLLTVGRLSYEPNHLGIDQFLTTVWPLVNRSFPDLKYKIAGARLPEDYHEKWSEIQNVEILGYVDDLDELYSNCIATIVPISSGGGTCIKVLESLAYSRICLSSEFGARGIPEADIESGNCGIFVYRDAEEFLSLLGHVIHDVKWREQEEKKARDYVTNRYSKERFFEQVKALIGKGD